MLTIIYISHNNVWSRRLKNRRYRFLLKLGNEITKPSILRRARNTNVLHPSVMRCNIAAGVYVARNTAA